MRDINNFEWVDKNKIGKVVGSINNTTLEFRDEKTLTAGVRDQRGWREWKWGKNVMKEINDMLLLWKREKKIRKEEVIQYILTLM